MIYEFYFGNGILIYCDKCRKSKHKFLHLYRNDIHVAAIDLSIFSVSFIGKSYHIISFQLKMKEKRNI